jgi:pyruvate/2-oxoglutarate dehydrogenase complex dihydrolipoamide acyltransferase (E2) component
MATSAETLSQILDNVATKYSLDSTELTSFLGGKGLLPKKLLASAKPKAAANLFASKAAEEFAKTQGIASLEGVKCSGAKGKCTIKDLKTFLEAPIKKVNASPSALKYARENGLDIARIASGTGAEGKVLLKDVKDLHEPDPPADSDEEGPKLSPAAAKLCQQYEIDDEDLVDIDGSGRDGKILASDLKEIVAEIKAEQ